MCEFSVELTFLTLASVLYRPMDRVLVDNPSVTYLNPSQWDNAWVWVNVPCE
jgi:hypothetical protein